MKSKETMSLSRLEVKSIAPARFDVQREIHGNLPYVITASLKILALKSVHLDGGD